MGNILLVNLSKFDIFVSKTIVLVWVASLSKPIFSIRF